MTIRKAKCEDAAAIARVHVESWRTTYKGIMPDEVLANLSIERRQAGWTRTLCDLTSPERVFVAENESGEIVGFTSTGPLQDNKDLPFEVELYTIYLLEAYQGKGLGYQLATAAVNNLIEQGKYSMLLWVLADNKPARRFYEKMGGQHVRNQKFEIGGASLDEISYGWPDIRNWPKNNSEI